MSIDTGYGKVAYIGAINSSSKLAKGDKIGVKTYGVYLAPADISGYNVCANATKGCKSACLFTSGRVRMNNNIVKARIAKTKMLHENPEEFTKHLCKEIENGYENATKKGFEFTCRINATSDLDITNIGGVNLLEKYPHITFYDYTKIKSRLELAKKYSNYHLTYSHNGMPGDWKICEEFLKAGQNVSVVFYPNIPSKYKGFEVIDGDINDLRYLDKKGTICGLKYKRIKNDSKENIIKNKFIVKVC